MSDFVALGEQLGVDRIHFAHYAPWEGRSKLNYKKEAVHFADHPMYGKFRGEINSLRSHPLVAVDY